VHNSHIWTASLCYPPLPPANEGVTLDKEYWTLALELAFADRDLRALCLNPSIASQELGDIIAEKLRRRLADIAAATVAADLFHLPGKPREITDQPGHMVIELINGWYLIFKSGHITERTLSTGEVDWTRVRRIKILKVEKRL